MQGRPRAGLPPCALARLSLVCALKTTLPTLRASPFGVPPAPPRLVVLRGPKSATSDKAPQRKRTWLALQVPRHTGGTRALPPRTHEAADRA